MLFAVIVQIFLTVLFYLNLNFDFINYSCWLWAGEILQLIFLDKTFRISIKIPFYNKFIIFPHLKSDDEGKFVSRKFHVWKKIFFICLLAFITYYTITFSKLVLPIFIILMVPLHQIIKFISPIGKPKGYVTYDSLLNIEQFMTNEEYEKNKLL